MSPTETTSSTVVAHVSSTLHARLQVPRRVGGPRQWWDWALAADPGLYNAQAGLSALVSMAVALAAGYGTARALDIPAMLGMAVAGLVGLMSAIAVAENTALRLARSLLGMTIPYAAVLPLTSWLLPHRVLVQSLMVAALALAFFLLRFGSLGLLSGLMMFNALIIGVILHIPLDESGRLSVVAVVTSAAILIARLLLCYPMPREDLLRTQRAFLIEARRVADSAATALAPEADKAVAVKRMRRALDRLNITTLTIDGHLARPEVAADPHMAELLHQYLFDAELALQGIGRSVQQATGTHRYIDVRLREAMVLGLVMVRDTHLGRVNGLHSAADLIRQQAAAAPSAVSPEEAETRALARRVGDLLDALADALGNWLQLGRNASNVRAKVPFQPAVALERNRPAGAGPAARRVAAAQDGQGGRHVLGYLRLPLQVGIAATIVCPFADAINPQRFYWGALGVMVTFIGTATTSERVRKLGHRVTGTVIGGAIGVALLHLIGPGHIYWTLLVITAGVTFGSWGMQRQYAYWVVGLVVGLVQLYGLTAPLSGMEGLLTQRLADNALGMVVATGCAAVIFPVSTRKIVREAHREYISALEQLITQIGQRWQESPAEVRLRGTARRVSAAQYQLRNAERPLIRMSLGVRGRRGENVFALLDTATQHAQALAVAADIDPHLAPHLHPSVERITQVFADSLQAMDQQIATGEPDGTWVRVSPMIHELELALSAHVEARSNRLHIALRQFAALDEVLAGVADYRGLTVTTSIGTATAALAGSAVTDAPNGPHNSQAHAAVAAWAVSTDRGPIPTGRHRAHSAPSWAHEPEDHASWDSGSGPLGADAAANRRPPRHAAPGAGGVGAPGRGENHLVHGHTAAAATHGRPRSHAGSGTVSVSGTLRCPVHPDGCQGWVTVVSGRGERRALVTTIRGNYQVTGLTPGGYTLIASSSMHAPQAEFLLVDGSGDVQRNFTLKPKS
ncbi:FUSC family protein [Streptomyces sp. NPDC004533]|uniref:FUSC family protein n=1 Tax=Streptomyces sp. NPDC004533 TaxID=3154278 RepID=UPI0033BBD184